MPQFKSILLPPSVTDIQWKHIQGSLLYYVHPLGFVKRQDNILKMSCSKGYAKATITYTDGSRKIEAVHRLVAKAFLPNPNNKPAVNHIDGIKINNQISNLEWATHSENKLHSFRVLNKEPGSGKLTRPQKLEIIKAYKLGSTLTELGNLYNVTKQAIFYIVKRSPLNE